ncbi:hypothetical protein QMK61_05140 [Fulvimonas sp. R45]|uniref:hypothetical protein n=1 Tax=Fulvimonas sp. R45 TaxID=3045937 RepID=UPI00265F496C|nr:hypothetical protein [Fulvimonas sp. R45]MDO1528214.1 hypothetical protein [Fulvimonas sp. R45]
MRPAAVVHFGLLPHAVAVLSPCVAGLCGAAALPQRWRPRGAVRLPLLCLVKRPAVASGS